MRVTQSGLRMRPLVATVTAFALSVAFAVRTSTADVGDHIPADALAVIKINNLQQVNQRAGAMLREFGLAEQHPEMADPLAAFQNETGLREGLNLEGNVALYIANHEEQEDGEPPFVMLLPVSDYQAFLGNFREREDLGEGVSRVRFGGGEEEDDEGEEGYVMQMGDYAAMSPHRQLLVKPEQTIRFSGLTGRMLDERDMVFYANFEQLGPMLTERLREENARENALAEMRSSLEENPQFARFQPVAEAAINQAFTVLENFLRDTTAAAVALNLRDQGIGVGGVAQFKPDSYMANLFSQFRTTEDSLLSGLPEGNYIVFGGSTDNRQANQRLFEELFGPILNELRDIEGTEQFRQYLDAARAAMTAAGETRMGVFAPSGPLGGGALLQQVTIQGGDVQQLRQAQRRMVELQPAIMTELLGEEMEEMEEMEGMTMQMQYTEGAKEIAGISFDRLAADIDPQSPAAMPMRMVFGPEGMASYLAEVDGRLVTVQGLTDQQITQVIEAVRANEAPLAQDRGVQTVREQLMPSYSSIVFFRPDELVRTGVSVARQAGFNLPIQMPENLPPIGMTAGPAENALQTEAFLPKDLISALIVAALQAQQQFGGMNEDGL